MHAQTIEKRWKEKLSKSIARHPMEAFVLTFVALPMGILLAVALCTLLAGLSFGLLCGWI